MDGRLHLSKIDLLTLATLIVAGFLFFGRGQYQRWSFLMVAIHFLLFEVFCLRLGWSFAKGVAVSVLVTTVFLLLLALACSMRHPPLIAPADWQWPPFEDFGQRFGHAVLLCVWQVALAPMGVVLALAYAFVSREWFVRRRDGVAKPPT